MEKIIIVLIIIINLCFVACTTSTPKVRTYKNCPMRFSVSIHHDTMYIEHGDNTLKLIYKNGEYYNKNKVYLSNKRNIYITQKVDDNICKIISIQKVMDKEENPDFKTNSKDIYVRKEYYVNSYEKDGEWPISKIYYDKNYKIIRIQRLENIDYTTSIK